jgi:transposase-like protein
MAIVWSCPLGVEQYAAAGQRVQVPRLGCPSCGQPMRLWSGYPRWVRVGGASWRVWVRRAKCALCGVTHALLPSFVLLRRLDAVEVIGAALEWAAGGAGLRVVAAGLGVPHTTVRDWWRRFRVGAPVLAAGVGALLVELGGLVAAGAGVAAERACLAALQAVAALVRGRLGGAALACWPLVALVSGGGWLAATTSPPWAGLGRPGWMPPAPRPPP